MSEKLTDHAQAYRLEFNLQAPNADYEPSDQYLLFDNKEAALSCMKNPPTHIGEKPLNYNQTYLFLVQYSAPDYWEIKQWVAEKRIFHFDDRHNECWQDS